MNTHDGFDALSSSANRDHGEADPRLEALVTEMTGAALMLVPASESEGFAAASGNLLRDLQRETELGQGQLPLDKLASVVGRHVRSEEFRRAGVTAIPFLSREGGFVLATAVGPSKHQQLVHVAAGGNWEDVLTDVQTAGMAQGTDRYGRSRSDETGFNFQRRAYYAMTRVMSDHDDSFSTVNRALSDVNRRLPDITAVQFGLPNYTMNITRNLAYACVDGTDIMGQTYDYLAVRYGNIDYNSARTLVAFETGVLTNAIFNNLVSAANVSE